MGVTQTCQCDFTAGTHSALVSLWGAFGTLELLLLPVSLRVFVLQEHQIEQTLETVVTPSSTMI